MTHPDPPAQAGNVQGSEKRSRRLGQRIVTEHVYPPIPIRQFDWVAHYDDPEGKTGWGRTKEEAVNDLLEHYECGGPTEQNPDRAYCKLDQSCCDFCCGN